MRKTGNTVLAIGAHPDDIELGAGGAVRKHVLKGDTVYGLVLTRGEKGKHHPSQKESIKAAKALGLKKLFILKFPDGKLSDDIKVVSAIEKLIAKLKPRRVYTHSPHDLHQDHINCSRATRRACRKGRVDEILLYQSPSFEASNVETQAFNPHYFIDITTTFKEKMSALSHYESQVSRGSINLEFVRKLAEHWGSVMSYHAGAGTVYKEAFEINHIIED